MKPYWPKKKSSFTAIVRPLRDLEWYQVKALRALGLLILGFSQAKPMSLQASNAMPSLREIVFPKEGKKEGLHGGVMPPIDSSLRHATMEEFVVFFEKVMVPIFHGDILKGYCTIKLFVKTHSKSAACKINASTASYMDCIILYLYKEGMRLLEKSPEIISLQVQEALLKSFQLLCPDIEAIHLEVFTITPIP